MVCFLQNFTGILAGMIPAIGHSRVGDKDPLDHRNQTVDTINKNSARRKEIIV